MNSATPQPPLHDSPQGCPSASAVSHRPRSPPRILVLFCRDFLFDFSVWWWRGEVGVLLEGETGGIQIRTRFCQTIFWGKDLAKPRLIFLGEIRIVFPPAERGLGNECGRASGILAGRFRLILNKSSFGINETIFERQN